MKTAEPTMELPTLPPGRRRHGMRTAMALGMTAVVAGGLGLALRDDGRARVRSEGFPTATTVTTMAQAPATTAVVPPPVTTRPPSTTAPAPTTTSPPTTVPERLTSASRLRLDGLGPVRVGMTLREAEAAAGVSLRLLDMPRDPSCRYAVPDLSSGTGDEIGFMVVEGKIVRIDIGIMGPDRILTVSGVGKGDTEAKVQTTYPGRIRVEPHPYVQGGHYLVYVPADAGFRDFSMIFETVDGTVRNFRAGYAGPVAWPEGCS